MNQRVDYHTNILSPNLPNSVPLLSYNMNRNLMNINFNHTKMPVFQPKNEGGEGIFDKLFCMVRGHNLVFFLLRAENDEIFLLSYIRT